MTFESLAGRVRSPGAVMALIAYLAGALLLLRQPLLHGSHACLCLASTTDAGAYVWGFEWFPHALWHGLNPFYTHLIYAPQGTNVAHAALAPGAAIILAPITAAAGPLFAFNLAMFLSPVLAAFFAFLLCRRVTGQFWPAVLGGWLFGFSSYMFGQLAGHLNLTLVFLIPAILHLVLRGLAGELSRTRLTVMLGLALTLQFSFSTEVFASLTLFGALALALTYWFSNAVERSRVRRLLGGVLPAYAATLIVVSPYLYYALQPGGLPIEPARSDLFSNDLLGFVLPTPFTGVGGLSFMSTAARFTASPVEGGAYLGIALIVVMLFALRATWPRTAGKVMLGMLVVLVVCTLGGHLHIDGPTSVPLPWRLVNRLPVLGLLLPARFVLYVVLIASVLAATWLAAARRRATAWLLAIAAVVLLWPAVGRNYWRSVPAIPKLFSTTDYKQVIHPHDTVLVLPVGISGQSMLWHAEARLGFTMAGGYVTSPEALTPYTRFAINPMLTYFTPVPNRERAAAEFLRAEHITVVGLDQVLAANGPWVPTLERLGWAPTAREGVVLLRHTGFVAEPIQPAPTPTRPVARGPIADQRAARHAAGRYLDALARDDTEQACRSLTPQAAAAIAQSRRLTARACARALGRLLRLGSAASVRSGHSRTGPAIISADAGYVVVGKSAQAPVYLPVTRRAHRWQVNGAPIVGTGARR